MNEFLTAGFEILQRVLSDAELTQLKAELDQVVPDKAKGGIRNADKKYSAVARLASSRKILDLAKNYIGDGPSLVRSILFDKNEINNWLVTWHQDKTIAVSDKVEIKDWGPWSIKDGIFHVQPPIEVLDKMVTFRIHIDTATEDNGCLRVLPGSHRYGVLGADALRSVATETSPFACEAVAGDVLVMKPHIVHSSSKAVSPSRRRVIHLEYSSYVLPAGLSRG